MPATGGRPFPTHTKLGQIMSARGLRAMDVANGADIYTRTMSSLLSGRVRPTPAQLAKLSRFFRVPPEALVEDSYPSEAQPLVTAVAG